jgi:hypothetical protein
LTLGKTKGLPLTEKPLAFPIEYAYVIINRNKRQPFYPLDLRGSFPG